MPPPPTQGLPKTKHRGITNDKLCVYRKFQSTVHPVTLLPSDDELSLLVDNQGNFFLLVNEQVYHLI